MAARTAGERGRLPRPHRSALAALSGIVAAGVLAPTAATAVPAPGEPDVTACGDLRAPHDELRIFLLTMPPGDQIWSVFGHNGLWVSKPAGASDVVYNYGVIDGDHPDMLQGFVEGTLDYLLGTRSFDSMLAFYGKRGRPVVAQRLDLPADALAAVAARLEDEARPDKRSYRYHWTDRNCATRIRDLLDDALGGQLRAQHRGPAGVTARDEVLRHLGPQPLLWFGWHFVVSAAADAPLDRWQVMFLPDRLYQAAEATVLRGADGEGPLVAERCELLAGRFGWPPTEPPRRDPWLWAMGLLLAAALILTGRRAQDSRAARAAFASLVALLGLAGGGLGGVSAWLWADSQLAGFHGSLNLLVANPATLLLVVVALAHAFGWAGLQTLARRIAIGLAAVALVGVAVTPFVTQPIAGPVGVFAPPLVAVAAVTRDLRRRGSSAARGRAGG